MENTIDYRWQKLAACKGMGIESFYPAHGKSPSSKLIDKCEDCPVSNECLEHALQYEEYGYWANTGPIDRREMRKERGIQLVNINIAFLQNQYIEESQKIQETTPMIKGRGRKIAQCGTRSGYGAHRRKKEWPCDACKAAQNKHVKLYNLNKKDKENEIF